MSYDLNPPPPDPPPNSIGVLCIVVFIVLLVLTAARPIPDDLGAASTDPRIEAPEATGPLLAGYWALCSHEGQCYSARLLYSEAYDQQEACDISMWATRIILGDIFGSGFEIATECAPRDGMPPDWWLKTRNERYRI